MPVSIAPALNKDQSRENHLYGNPLFEQQNKKGFPDQLNPTWRLAEHSSKQNVQMISRNFSHQLKIRYKEIGIVILLSVPKLFAAS